MNEIDNAAMERIASEIEQEWTNPTDGYEHSDVRSAIKAALRVGGRWNRLYFSAIEDLAVIARTVGLNPEKEGLAEILDRISCMHSEMVGLGQHVYELEKELEDAKSAPPPAGYALVPIEPTKEMLEAGGCFDTSRDSAPNYKALRCIWADMIYFATEEPPK